MLTLRHHNSNDYEILPDIDDTDAGIITVGDQSCLDEIGDCLLEAKVQSRFAVTLLHSHFPIDDDETLLEEVNVNGHVMTLRPVRGRPSGVFATNICFDDAGACGKELKLVGLEFASSETLSGIIPINDSDRNVLTSVVGILRRHWKTRRFGVRLLHDPLDLKGDVLLETCDPINRVLTCRSDAVDGLTSVRSIPTVFRWEEAQVRSGNGAVTSQECIQFCRTVQRCLAPTRGSHSRSSSHEPTGHQSI